MASEACTYCLGAYILHKFDDGSIKPIVLVSRTLLPAGKITLRLKNYFSELYLQIQNFIVLFMEDISHYRQTTNYSLLFMVQKGVCQLIEQIGSKDGELFS